MKYKITYYDLEFKQENTVIINAVNSDDAINMLIINRLYRFTKIPTVQASCIERIEMLE